MIYYTDVNLMEKGVHIMYPCRIRSIEKRLNGTMDRIAVKLVDSLDFDQRTFFKKCIFKTKISCSV